MTLENVHFPGTKKRETIFIIKEYEHPEYQFVNFTTDDDGDKDHELETRNTNTIRKILDWDDVQLQLIFHIQYSS